jgi:hypothetical protein
MPASCPRTPMSSIQASSAPSQQRLPTLPDRPTNRHAPVLMRLSSHFGLTKRMDTGGWQKQVRKTLRRKHSHFVIAAKAAIHVTHGVTSRVYEPDPLGELNPDCSACIVATRYGHPPVLTRLSKHFGLHRRMNTGRVQFHTVSGGHTC